MDKTPLERWVIGDVVITKVTETLLGPVSADFFFPDATPEQIARHDWLRPHFVTPEGLLTGSLHTFVLETKGLLVLVDTCIGNDKARVNPAWDHMQTTFLDNLTALGYASDKIDLVICTHLHVDHVGWNTKLVEGKWVPTFKNARYLFSRAEWEHWSAPGVKQITPDDTIEDSVRPVVDAGLVDLVESDHRINDEIWLEPTPGHSPAHVSVHIQSHGAHAVITGDMIHHPLQIGEPDLITHFCYDVGQARKTRREFLKANENIDVLILGTHFDTPTAGRIVTHGDGWKLET